MYRVFVNNHPFILSAKKLDNYQAIKYLSDDDFDKAFQVLQEGKAVNIYSKNIDDVWKRFKKKYKNIKAAGGIVENTQNEILMIHRLGKWDLPKGKMEKGESKKETAVREVEEECGIHNLSLTNQLPTTYHVYFTDQPILKITYWYAMKYDGKEAPVPQTEEGITEIKWWNKSKLSKPLQNTFGNISSLLAFYLNDFATE